MEWFRSYHGAPTDPKWISIAKRSETQPGFVAAIWWALMDFASQSEDRGSLEGFDPESVADFFGFNHDAVDRIIAALREKRLIDVENNRISMWHKRQPKREDLSTSRVRAHRDRKKGNATPANETKGNAVERSVTHGNARGEESREEKKRVTTKAKNLAAAPRRNGQADGTDPADHPPEQLPATLDDAVAELKAQTPATGHVTWLTPLAGPWEAKFGHGTFHFGKWAKQLQPFQRLLADRPPDEVAQRFTRYLATLDRAKFASPVRFCETYEEHAAVPAEDYVGPVNGWMTPEMDRLTRPA